MNSAAFAPYLILVGPNGNVVAQDDNGGSGRNSLINSFTLPTSGVYTIEATAVSSSGRGAYTASLNPITVVSPNGGEIWSIGSKPSIQWTSTGFTGNVRIQLSRNGGGTWANLFESTANDGSQSWKVMKPPTTQGRIRICSVKVPTICDTSERIDSSTVTSLHLAKKYRLPFGCGQRPR